MAEAKEKKPPKQYGFVLVSIPGFPSQDPGRWLLFRVYPDAGKAERKAKRLKKRMPEYEWKGEGMTLAESRALKHKPFRLAELGVEVRPTGRGAKVVPIGDAASGS